MLEILLIYNIPKYRQVRSKATRNPICLALHCLPFCQQWKQSILASSFWHQSSSWTNWNVANVFSIWSLPCFVESLWFGNPNPVFWGTKANPKPRKLKYPMEWVNYSQNSIFVQSSTNSMIQTLIHKNWRNVAYQKWRTKWITIGLEIVQTPKYCLVKSVQKLRILSRWWLS